jgi:methanethiol S-methyltransferase
MGVYFSYYRILYVIISVIPLIFMVVYMQSSEPEWIFRGNIITTCLSVLIVLSGMVIIKKSFRKYSLREFIGISYPAGEEHVNEMLKTSGILSIVRHPLYTGTILVFGGYFLSLPSISNLITLLCILIYIFIGIRLEENKLIIEFGEEYTEYKKKVPMLFPGKDWIPGIKKYQKN